MRKKILIVAAIALFALAGIAAAKAGEKIVIRAGNLIIIGEGGFSPTTLPKNHDAPIEIHGGGELKTVDGGFPPILETISFEFDKHGHVDTTGLPVCTAGRLQATTPSGARHMCPNSIVGTGKGSAVVVFPEQAPIHVSSPITVFNGPRKHGQPTVLAHAYTTVPAPTTFIVPVVIERVHHGVYGYRTKARIPRIAGGYGIPISGRLKIDRKWTYKGVRHSYVNARCATGHLQARGEFLFKDGTFLKGNFFRPCHASG